MQRQLKFGLRSRNRLVCPYPPDTRLLFVAEENTFFDYVIVGLKPQINANLMAGNYPAMTADDKARCARLISPLPLMTIEDWCGSISR